MVDPHSFTTPLERALCVLDVTDGITAAGITRVLREQHGIDLHWNTIGAALDDAKGLVARRKKGGRWYYQILHDGRARVATPMASTTFIDPGKALQNIVTLHDFLAGLTGTVRACDPYLDSTTIEHLDSCPRPVRLLTHNVKDSGRLRQAIGAFAQSGRSIAIRQTPKPDLHDRYIIDDKGMTILGTSLNGFGKKQSFVIRIGQDIRSTMLSAFDTQWAAANAWPTPSP